MGAISSPPATLTSLGVTAAAQTVLDDTTVAAMLTTLGAAPAAFTGAVVSNSGLRITTAIPDSTGLTGSINIPFQISTYNGYNFSGTVHVGLLAGALGNAFVSWTAAYTGTPLVVKVGFAFGFLRVNFGLAVGVSTSVALWPTSSTVTAAQLTGWALSDATDAGLTTATANTGAGPLSCTTLAGTGALTGFTTGAFSSTVTAGADVILSDAGSTGPIIRTTSVDAADNKIIRITPAGAFGVTRGAYLQLSGNEAGFSADGSASIICGDVANGNFYIYTGNLVQCAAFNRNQTVTLHATTAGSWAQQMPFRGIYAYKTTDQGSLAATTHTKVTFGTESEDSNSAFASSTFTAPIAGRYKISVNAYVTSSAATEFQLEIYKNGSRVTTLSKASYFNLGDYALLSPVWIINLAANDTIEIYEYHGAGTGAIYGVLASTDTGATSLAIEFLGT